MSIIITILAFGVMIFIHELGHFITAKHFGVLVHEFSMGMGPKLFSFKKGETSYSLRLFPIGGYVKLEGETESEDETDPRSFINLSPIKRIIVLFSGALMNILLGFMIFIIINFSTGIMPSIVASVPEELNQTLIKPGDEIIRLNNTKIHTFDDVSLFMSRYDKDELSLTVKRNGQKLKFDNYKLFNTDSGYKIGVSFETKKGTLLENIEYASYDTLFTTKVVLYALGDLITAKIPVSTLSGPVEIVSVVGEATNSQNINDYTYLWLLSLVAMISVNLGVFNLLPFPALDGGSIVFAIYELITRKKVKSEVIGYVTAVGFILLMILAVFVTAGDIIDVIKK